MSRAMESGRQQGAVLIIAMIFLLLITLVSVASMRMGTMELMMSTNEQSRAKALQFSQAMADGTIENWKDNFIPDKKICKDVSLDSDCDPTLTIIIDPSVVTMMAGATVSYFSEYLGEKTGIGDDVGFRDYLFRLETFYDNAANRQGKSEVVTGVKISKSIPGLDPQPDGDIDQYAHLSGD